MMRLWRVFGSGILSVGLLIQAAISSASDLIIQSRSLSALPDSPGVASPFAGIVDGALVIGGGANFPDAPPWKGGRKVWHDQVYRLEPSGWTSLGRLPRPLAYGLSFQTAAGVLCVGGSDETSHHREAFVLSSSEGRLSIAEFPQLLEPVANACGAMAGSTAIVAGGTASPDATSALQKVWAIDVNEKPPQWRRLPDIPGAGRMLSVAAASSDSFYLLSGASLSKGDDGKPKRSYLRDAWKLDLKTLKWHALPDMPAATVAAPSPAPLINGMHIVILGGDDGTLVGFQPPEDHPGFRRKALSFDLNGNQWNEGPDIPVSRVTVPLVLNDDVFLLPSGEMRPGIRSPEVFELTIRTAK